MKYLQPARLLVFIVSVIALAKFFEAGRLIAAERTFAHFGMSFISIGVFVSSLLIMGYWIYEEEKGKNNLRVKFRLYEWFYERRKLKNK